MHLIMICLYTTLTSMIENAVSTIQDITIYFPKIDVTWVLHRLILTGHQS